ncbi:MAG: L,D-transpeptidase family protein [Acidimicrobiia bacterium]
MAARRITWLVAAFVPVSGCATIEETVDDAIDAADAPRVVAAVPSAGGAPAAPTTIPVVTLPPELDRPTTTATTSAPTTTTPVTTTTIPPAPMPDEAGTSPAVNLVCTVTVLEGETLRTIAERYDDETIDLTSIVAENALTSTDVAAGTVLDICPGNGLDDVTGTERVVAGASVLTGVEAQQEQLNRLFDGLGIEPLLVDGISGPVTRQRLCTARLALGLPTSTADLEPGSQEEALLFATETLPIPYTSAILSERWILIDLTCQIMFVGRGAEAVDFVFPTSTGQAEFPTRPQDRTRAFRYNPVLHNNGWHNSTTYPVAADNPLNGNMYKPLYFDGGQAIHGANNVPRSPASHGCARLRVGDQDRLVEWLGLAGIDGHTNDPDRIAVTVNVQGTWRG